MEWGLDQSVSDKIQVRMGRCNIDLFASSQNNKLPLYASYKPDKSAYAINAFSLKCNTGLYYAFPPFSCISRIIQKVIEEEADLILVAPLFSTQTWFPHVLKLVSGDSFILPKVDHLLYLPKQGKVHCLTSMRMVVSRLAGNNSCRNTNRNCSHH